MRITVRRTAGDVDARNLELDFEPVDRRSDVVELNRLIAERSGVPARAQRLFHKGRCLRGSSSFKEHGIPTEGAVILFAVSAHYKGPVRWGASPSDTTTEDQRCPVAGQAPADRTTSPEVSGNSSSAGTSPNLSVAELKQRLKDLGVPYEGCTEKSELVELLHAHEADDVSGGTGPSGTASPPLPPMPTGPAPTRPAGSTSPADLPGLLAGLVPELLGSGASAWDTMSTAPGASTSFNAFTVDGGGGRQQDTVASFMQQFVPLLGSEAHHFVQGPSRTGAAPEASRQQMQQQQQQGAGQEDPQPRPQPQPQPQAPHPRPEAATDALLRMLRQFNGVMAGPTVVAMQGGTASTAPASGTFSAGTGVDPFSVAGNANATGQGASRQQGGG
eukprot:CAMPEP_0117558566 /NCGR_PEP_ID=MMETSP0784-20121206/52908_1 /TAXON_ID=39447 /ORGANISM="" /LENGTH=387 /DNA_ID=CAMNT_0005355911 /DNA_START=158 /DNA_END=1321 /DNA_ORIENTATION=-